MGERESYVRFSAVRGQSEVLAIVLLIGFVLIAAISVLVVGSAALGAAQDQSTSERNQNEITAVSHAVETSIQSGNPNTMTGLQNSYELSEGAEISIIVDGTQINQTIDTNTGQLRYDGLVYEGGLVMDGEQVVRSPSFQFEAGSSMIQIPTFIDYKNGGSFDGEIRPQGRTAPTLRPEDSLVIEIESEYSQQWADAFEGANAIVTENNGVTRVKYNVTDTGPRDIAHSLSLGADEGSSFNLNDMPNTHIESYRGNYDPSTQREKATVAVKSEKGNYGGDLMVYGKLFSAGDKKIKGNSNNIEVTRGIESVNDLEEPTPTSELLISPDKARGMPGAEEYEAGDDLTGGVYYVDGSTTLSSDIEVTEESILVVDGELTIEDATIEAKEALDVHVHGSLHLEDGAEVTTAGPHQGDQVSIFVRDDISVAGHATVTGLLYGTSSTVDIGSSQLDVYGGMAIGELVGSSKNNHKGGHFNLYYDEDLEGESPYATSSVPGSVLSDFFTEYEGRVHEGDLTVNGGSPGDGQFDDDLLVDGAAEIRNSDKVKGALYVKGGTVLEGTTVDGDLISSNGLEVTGGVIEGETWAEGDTKLSGGTNFHDDLLVNGDTVIKSGTFDGNVYVVGDLTIDGNPNFNGEVHVLGDLHFDGEPISGSTYVDGDATVKNHINGDLHASGFVECDGGNVNGDLYVGDGSTGCGSPESGDPTAPAIPTQLVTAPEITSLSGVEDDRHSFNIRIAELELD